MEIAQICADAALAERQEILTEAEEMLLNIEVEPEAIIDLWNRLNKAAPTWLGIHLKFDPVELASDNEPNRDMNERLEYER
jgi:hypothetical protein